MGSSGESGLGVGTSWEWDASSEPQLSLPSLSPDSQDSTTSRFVAVTLYGISVTGSLDLLSPPVCSPGMGVLQSGSPVVDFALDL